MIRWSEKASIHLEAVWVHIASDSPEAATAAVRRIVQIVERQLQQFPNSGRVGRVPGTRELALPPYLVVYRVGAEAVTVEAVLHGSQRYP